MSTAAPSASDLARYARDPMAFFADLVLPIPGRPRLGDCWAPWQVDAFRALAPTLRALATGRQPPITDFWLERTKGGSKDTDIAAAVLWLLAFAPTPLEMRAGASDFGQIDELRKALRDWVRCNEWLSGRVEIQTTKALNPSTGSQMEFLTCDSTGSHGSRPALTVINELSHLRSREFAETLQDDRDKIPWTVMIVGSNAGIRGSWQWGWREAARQQAEESQEHFFQKVDAPAPWISEKRLAAAQTRNSPQRFARLWKGVWTTGGGDALDMDDVGRCVVLPGPLDYPEVGHAYIGGLDLGVRHDFSGLTVLGSQWQSGKVKLALSQSWKPSEITGKVDLWEVEFAVLESYRRYHLQWVGYDPNQAEYMAQRLIAQGVNMVPVFFTGEKLNEMALSLLQAFRNRLLDLYPCPELLADLEKLSIVEQSNFRGHKLVAASDETGHADRGISLAIALPLGIEISQTPAPTMHEPERIEWVRA